MELFDANRITTIIEFRNMYIISIFNDYNTYVIEKCSIRWIKKYGLLLLKNFTHDIVCHLCFWIYHYYFEKNWYLHEHQLRRLKSMQFKKESIYRIYIMKNVRRQPTMDIVWTKLTDLPHSSECFHWVCPILLNCTFH